MKLPSWAVATIRTLVQAGVAALLELTFVQSAVVWVADNLGVSVTPQTVENAAFAVALAVVVALVNWVPRRFPRLGGWISRLISLGAASSPAVYGENVQAEGETPIVVEPGDDPAELDVAPVAGFADVLPAHRRIVSPDASDDLRPKGEWGYAYDD